MTDNEKSGWIEYPSGLGYDPIDFPSLYGFDEFGKTTVSIKPRDIADHICAQVESAIESVDGLFQYRESKTARPDSSPLGWDVCSGPGNRSINRRRRAR